MKAEIIKAMQKFIEDNYWSPNRIVLSPIAYTKLRQECTLGEFNLDDTHLWNMEFRIDREMKEGFKVSYVS
jgi:hypothetical protein